MDNPLKPSKLPSQDNPWGIWDWCQQALAEGNAFITTQSGYDDIDQTIKQVMGDTYKDKLRPSSISQLQVNHTGKIALDLASSLTDIKPFWEYRTNNQRCSPDDFHRALQQATGGSSSFMTTGRWASA